MKALSRTSPHLIAGLVIAVTLGLLVVMHVTSAHEERCSRDIIDIGFLKMI